MDPRIFLVLVRIAPLFLSTPSLSPYSYFSVIFSDFSFSGDFLAGLTVACILIPQSVSYGTSLARLTPTAGLVCRASHFALSLVSRLIRAPNPQFSASIPGIFYAMFGSSRQLNVAPEAALSLLVGQAITDIMHEKHHKAEDRTVVGFKVVTAIALQSGLFSFLLGLFRLGFIDVILSRALLSGFVAAVGIVISM